MYQPDALNRYMSAGNSETDTPPVPPPTQHQQPPAMWPQYPQIPMYSYVYHPPSMVPPSHQLQMSTGAVAGQAITWNHNASPAPYGAPHQSQYPPPPQAHIPPSASTLSTVTTHAVGSHRHSVAGIGQMPSHQYNYRQTGTPGRRYPRRELQWK